MRYSSQIYAIRTATAAIALLAGAATASAQQAAQNVGLEEITVTAQRYTENLQRTPLSVTALTADALAERQVFNIRDLQAQIPGAIVANVVGLQTAPRIFLRGVGQDSATFNSDSAVGTYVDGIYIPRLYAGMFDFVDVDRIEVLRGPQGTLYGRNTSGGAIKLITKRPSLDSVAGSVEAGYGTFNQFDAKAYLTAPIIEDKLGASVSGLVRRRDGFVSQPSLGKKVNNRDVTSVRGKFLFAPSDAFEAELIVDHTTDDSGAFFPVAIQSTSPTLPLANRFRDILVTDSNYPNNGHAEVNGVTLNGKYTVGDFTLSSLSGLRNVKQDVVIPLDGAPNSTLLSQLALNDTSFSQEFNGTYQTDKFSLVGGVYYFFERVRAQSPLGANAELSKQRTNSYAGYAQGTFHVTEQLSVTGGIRYTNDKKNFYNYYYVPSAAVPVRVPKLGDASWSSWTPKASVDFQVTPDVLLYASYSRGFKGGGWNRVPPSVQAGGVLVYNVFPYGPENVNAFEVGAKFQSADNRIRLNVAAFYNKYTGLQISQQIPGTTIARTTNASGARVQGVEFEPSWQVTDTFRLYGNGAFTGAKYTESYICQLNGIFQECRTKKLKDVIPFKGTLGFSFTPDLGTPGKFRLGASVDYSDKYYNDAVNTEILAARGRILLDAVIGYDYENWTVSIEGKNLTDKRYWSSALPVGATSVIYPNDPRTVFGRIKYSF